MTSTNTPGAGAEAPATPEEIWAILRRTSDLMAESRADIAKSQADIAKSQADFEKSQADIEKSQADIAKSRADFEKSQADIAKSRADFEKSRAESRAASEKSRAERQADFEKGRAEMAELREYQKKTARQMEETDRRLKKAEGLFTSQWGKLMESLVEGDLVPLLKQRGIEVERTLQRMTGRRNGEHFEIDIVAANGAEVVVVEVKTTLGSEDVTEFLDKLSQFVEWSPEYRERRIYGAVAYLKSDVSVTKYADRRGLFVIRATGSSASIVNELDFEPRLFG